MTAQIKKRSATAIEQGSPIPFGGEALDINEIASSEAAKDVIAAWRAQDVPDSDSKQMRADYRAYTSLSKMKPETFDTRYRNFFKDLKIADSTSRRFFANLAQLLPS